MMRNTGRLYAFDVAAHRLDAMKPRLARSGLSNVYPAAISGERDDRIRRLAGKIDRVLVDAPCTGLGTLRRNPDLKWRQSPQAVQELQARQVALLGAASRLLRPGGRLVYGTCSLLADENERVCEAFQAQHGERILELALNRPVPTWTMPQLMWLVRHEPAVAAATRHVYVAKDWLRMRMCGAWHTDVTDAVGTLLWDHGAQRWSEELCGMIGWDVTTLPPVVGPTDRVGSVTAEASRECGLPVGTPVVCGTSDTSAESYGAGSD
jgi:hypothetical protein